MLVTPELDPGTQPAGPAHLAAATVQTPYAFPRTRRSRVGKVFLDSGPHAAYNLLPAQWTRDVVNKAQRPLRLQQLLRAAIVAQEGHAAQGPPPAVPATITLVTVAKACVSGRSFLVRARNSGKRPAHDWIAVFGGNQEVWYAKCLLLFHTLRPNPNPDMPPMRQAWMLIRYLEDVPDVQRPHVPEARHLRFTRDPLHVEPLDVLLARVLLVPSPRLEAGRVVYLLLPHGRAARCSVDVARLMSVR